MRYASDDDAAAAEWFGRARCIESSWKRAAKWLPQRGARDGAIAIIVLSRLLSGWGQGLVSHPSRRITSAVRLACFAATGCIEAAGLP